MRASCVAACCRSLLGGLAVAALALPASAQAHGIVGQGGPADPRVAVQLGGGDRAGGLVRRALDAVDDAAAAGAAPPRGCAAAARRWNGWPALVGVGLFALVLYSGFAGAQVPQANFSVTFIYVIFWVGMPLASVLFGDVFRALSPWRTCARVLGRSGRVAPARSARARRPLLRYPEWLGMWPAVAGIVGFAWLELVYVPPTATSPSTLAALSLGYFLVMLAGMALFGVEEWGGQADGFGVVLQPALAAVGARAATRTACVCLRRPLSGITDLEIRPGTVALICTIIGTTTFDGFSNGGIWRNNEPSLQSLFSDLGFSPTPALRAGLLGRAGALHPADRRRLPARDRRRAQRQRAL